MHILNSILHLEPVCATSSFHFSKYLITYTPTLQIIFLSRRLNYENRIAKSNIFFHFL